MLDGGFHLHRKWYGLLEGFFSFRGSLVALKVVQIAGWWLLFAPKVVRTCGRCFSFCGSRVALKVVQIAGWWLSFAPKVVRTTGRCFSFRGSRVALEVVQIAAFIFPESGTDFWKGFFLFVVPLWH